MVYAFVINMALKRPDRRRHMANLMSEMGWRDYEFIEPFEKDVKDPDAANTSLRNTIVRLIFPRAAELGLDYFVVFEDDVMQMDGTRGKTIDTIDKLVIEANEIAWDMIYLEYCLEVCSLGMRVSSGLQEAVTPFCAAAILFNGSSLFKIADCLATYPYPMSFAYSTCIREGRVRALVASPPLFAQDVIMQGDLNHGGVHWYLNWIFKMYDPLADKSKPRLPHCVDSASVLQYLTGFFWLVLSIVVFFVLAWKF